MDHFFQNINGWSHYLEPWYEYVIPTLPENPSVVEVGCWHGRSTAYLAVELINQKQTFQLWAVDHWLGCEEPFYYQNGIKDELERDVPFKTFMANMEPVKHKLNIIRDTSANAAQQFDDHSLDLIILDDEHSEEGVINSILAWWPKLKINGIICGDDHDGYYAGVMNGVRKVYGDKDDSYHVYTKLGWGTSINDHGVWVIRKTQDVIVNQLSKPQDPWQYKLPLNDLFPQEPEPQPEPEPVSTVQEEQIIPTSALQNPKMRSII